MHELGREEALEILGSAPVAHVGVIDGDVPYVTPMSFVVDGDAIYFRTMAGKKLHALERSPKVCVETSRFDEETGDWESVIVMGTADVVEDRDLKENTVSLLYRKYDKVMGSPLDGAGAPRPDAMLVEVVRVRIEKVTGMTSGRGFAARSKPGRL